MVLVSDEQLPHCLGSDMAQSGLTYGNSRAPSRIVETGVSVPPLQRIDAVIAAFILHGERVRVGFRRLRHVAGFLGGTQDAFATEGGLALELQG